MKRGDALALQSAAPSLPLQQPPLQSSSSRWTQAEVYAFFDGFESHGANIPIELVGKPVYSGATDTYYNVDAAGTVHPPSPQCWSCKDTYILLTPGDMRFNINGEPANIPTQRDLNQLPPVK